MIVLAWGVHAVARTRLAALGLVFCLVLAAGACRADALEYETIPAHIEAAPWTTTRSPGYPPVKGHAFRLEVMSGMCIGRPRPRLDHVKVIEHPKGGNLPRKAVLITAYVREPEETRVIPPPESDHVAYNVCVGVGLGFDTWIKLKQPVSGLLFYDGARTPPRRIWPPVTR